jgi:hypothetical protein
MRAIMFGLPVVCAYNAHVTGAFMAQGLSSRNGLRSRALMVQIPRSVWCLGNVGRG